MLLQIARASLVSAVERGSILDLSGYALTDTLKEKHGAFVTLHTKGQLRGCVGYIVNVESLAVAVRDNASNAALRDNRFSPLRPDELADTLIEISAMTPGDSPESPFRRIQNLEEVKIGRDGLYVQRPPHKGGLLLPQVAVEQNWDTLQFLAATCRKAGYPIDAWRDAETRIYRFSAQVFGEEDAAAT
jgi:AmmeMemoRadiSam system protein A